VVPHGTQAERKSLQPSLGAATAKGSELMTRCNSAGDGELAPWRSERSYSPIRVASRTKRP